MSIIERFAPSPTGPLHLGHAFSALTAFQAAQAANGEFLLRIEDIDRTRCKPEWEAMIYDDLNWLGISWKLPVWRQSEHIANYRSALSRLWTMGLLYPCNCKRRDIEAAARAPQEGAEPNYGPDGIIYPGTCRIVPAGKMPDGQVLRLNTAKAITTLPRTAFKFTDLLKGEVEINPSTLPDTIGDVVISRIDSGTSYHLSVVLDDAAQNITHVTRGKDLLDATTIHVLLQKLLDLPTPIYRHHRLIRDADGKRLAKRDDAKSIAKFREDGATPQDIRAMIGR